MNMRIMNDRTTFHRHHDLSANLLAGGVGVVAAASLSAGRPLQRPSMSISVSPSKRKTLDEHDYHQRRHADLLQGLGQWTTVVIQPWLAALGGCV